LAATGDAATTHAAPGEYDDRDLPGTVTPGRPANAGAGRRRDRHLEWRLEWQWRPGLPLDIGQHRFDRPEASLRLGQEILRWKHNLQVAVIWAETDGDKSADGKSVRGRTEYSPIEKSYAFGQARYQGDTDKTDTVTSVSLVYEF
jgi:hypothetical protein